MTLRRFWRVIVIGTLAGILTFAGSFLIGSSYEAKTRMLIRGRDATFLTNTGNTLENQPGVIDSSMATALGATQSALLSSRRVSEMVVDDLGLDQSVPRERSALDRVRDLFHSSVHWLSAMLTYGSVPQANAHDTAVDRVYSSLSAQTFEDSYVLELTATASSPELAAGIANSAANALVAVSLDRFKSDAQRYQEFLQQQVQRAATEEMDAASELRRFGRQHHISKAVLRGPVGLDPTDIGTQLSTARVDLAAAQAELATLDQRLGDVAPTASSVSNIRTGRSTTRIEATGQSTTYQQLVVTRNTSAAQVAALRARVATLERLEKTDMPPALTEPDVQLRQLQLRYSIAGNTYRQLNQQYQQATVNAKSSHVDITRIDRATPPVYPVWPKRYLFLLMGLLVGGVAGFVLTYLHGWRPSHQQALLVDITDDDASVGQGRRRVGRFEVFEGAVTPTDEKPQREGLRGRR
jgi:succinoglycan biosynthesis transport protein ExoP